MNPRIEKLAQQAGYTPLPGFDFANSLEEVFIQKFAELIVRECAEIADLADENKCEWIGGNILTHFGVK